MGEKFLTIKHVVERDLLNPVFVFRPLLLKQAIQYFQTHFTANILYAVKTNPEPHVIVHAYESGVRNFEVASLQEIELVKKHLPSAKLYFMHPVKARKAIKEAYFTYGIRHFSLDTQDELDKILQETNQAKDLYLHLRLAIPNVYAEHDLSGKFGIGLQEAVPLLKNLKDCADKVGICFHVGSQCMHPDAYRIAIQMAKEVIQEADVNVASLNVGGGFPSIYPGLTPPPLKDYFDTIHEEFSKINSKQPLQLLAEPGRALVAETTSLIVRVELRKEDALYINDGTYGGLFDAGSQHLIFPTRLLCSKKGKTADLFPYYFYGPTCDSLDHMKGPFYLPKDVSEGDYIEIGQMGAYGRSLASQFNGFSHEPGVVLVKDSPIMSMYDK